MTDEGRHTVSSLAPASTFTTRAITEDETRSYARDGFVLVKQAFAPTDLAAVGREIQRLEALPERPGQHWVYGETLTDPEERRIISRMEFLERHSPVFSALGRALTEYAAAALGSLPCFSRKN